MNLTEVPGNAPVVITRLRGPAPLCKRLLEMGFIKGTSVSVVRKAPLQDPLECLIKGFHVSLRISEAKVVEVEPAI